MKTLLKILTIFIAIGAVAGAVMMWMDPSGVSWGGGPMLDMLRAKMPCNSLVMGHLPFILAEKRARFTAPWPIPCREVPAPVGGGVAKAGIPAWPAC